MELYSHMRRRDRAKFHTDFKAQYARECLTHLMFATYFPRLRRESLHRRYLPYIFATNSKLTRIRNFLETNTEACIAC